MSLLPSTGLEDSFVSCALRSLGEPKLYFLYTLTEAGVSRGTRSFRASEFLQDGKAAFLGSGHPHRSPIYPSMWPALLGTVDVDGFAGGIN